MRSIVISEDVAKEIKKECEMTEHRFMCNVKYFLAQLLEDPVNTEPSKILEQHGFDRVTLLRELTDAGVLKRSEKISDKDKDGNWKTATMMIKYNVRKAGLDTALLRIYTRHFDEDKSEINEDGGGACACDGGMAFDVPVFPMMRRTGLYASRKKKKKHNGGR